MRTTEINALLVAANPAAPTAQELTVLDQRARDDLATVLATSVDPVISRPADRRHLPHRRPTARLVALAASVAVIAATGVVVVRSIDADQQPAITAAGSGPDADALLRAFASSDGAAKVVSSPGELAAESDLVAIGRFVRFQSGRTAETTNGSDGFQSTSTVMVLRDVHVVQGQLPSSTDGLLYVETSLGGEDGIPTDAAAALPAESEVLVYTRTAWDGAKSRSYDSYLVNPDAGRPLGQPLYTVVGVQGLAIQAAGDVVVWPQLDRALPGTLKEASPSGSLIWTP